ncbi:MAG: fasciclin domain-containing protein [bacterium]|nr:fasciclin domain-containing protein [bacterium]
MLRLFVSLTIAALLASTFAFAGDTQVSTTAKTVPTTEKMTAPPTFLESAHRNPEVGTFVKQGEIGGIQNLLDPTKIYTVFAPTNNAYEACPASEKELMKSPQHASASMRSLVVPDKKLSTADLLKMDGQTLKTIDGQMLTVHVKDNKIMIGDATVKGNDMPISNTILHEIDKVIMPVQHANLGMKEHNSKVMNGTPLKTK